MTVTSLENLVSRLDRKAYRYALNAVGPMDWEVGFWLMTPTGDRFVGSYGKVGSETEVMEWAAKWIRDSGHEVWEE